MTYQQTVDWMFQQLPMYQQVGSKAYRVDLTNIKKLSALLNEPHEKFKTIHIAGTNGKGSVSHMLASVLQESGYKVGLYTSPHLRDFRERIKINGEMISEDAVIDFISRNKDFFEGEQLSFFEMTVEMAFQYFAEQKVDIAVIEVGLGGRLDSTNIITPELSVITNIGFDHVNILGDSLAKIAAEKGGIIKQNIPVVVGEFHKETFPVFEQLASERQAAIYLAEDLRGEIYESDLKGSYQQKNIRTAVMALQVLKEGGWQLPEAAIKKGLKNVIFNTGLRGRWEVLRHSPKVICDTAHNEAGLQYTMKQLQEEEYENLHLVIGVVNDKELDKILPLFPKNGMYYFARPGVPRGMDAEILKEAAAKNGLFGKVYNSVAEAYETAVQKAQSGDLIYVGGSTFTVAEII